MVDRRRMPKERHGFTRRFEIRSSQTHRHACPKCAHVWEEPVGDVKGYITTGLYDDGTVGEVFVKLDKLGSTVSGLMDAWAIAVSMLRQCGVPLEELVAKFRGSRFEPAGLTGESPDDGIRVATSPVDYVMKYLGRRYPPPPDDAPSETESV